MAAPFSMTEAAESSLRWLLRPIEALLADPALTDLHIEGPGEATIDRGAGLEPIALPFTLADLEDIAILSAALTGQDIAADVPIVSTKWPDGERVQIQRPPAVAEGKLGFSIRKPLLITPKPEALSYANPEWRDVIGRAVRLRRNVVFCGMVGSGKTTAMRAFTWDFLQAWRIVTIEDAPELINLPIKTTALFYSAGGQSVANTTAERLVEAALRMGPDGILMQELRDTSALSFLGVLESGHWGMTTTHARSARDALDRICGLVKKHPTGAHLQAGDIIASLARSIDLIVYCERDGARRFIKEVLDVSAEAAAGPYALAAE